MADTKISALPASTTPLAGTEVLPIVQSSVTKQVSIANLTAGRAISATQLTLTTGNVIVASGQGIDFAATPGTGTSELLADYEEGTWTPTFATGWTTAPTVANANYTKIGNTVTVFAYLYFGVSTTAALIGGLPFTSNAAWVATGTIFESSPAPGTVGGIAILPSSSSINFNKIYAGGASFFQLSITYFV